MKSMTNHQMVNKNLKILDFTVSVTLQSPKMS